MTAIFNGWRAAARAMRWARKQPGVTADSLRFGALRDARWRGRGYDVRIGRSALQGITDLRVSGPSVDVWINAIDTAEALRMLAALKLIPDELAQVHEETAERCTWCHRLGHAADQHPLPKTHPQYNAFYDASDDELLGIVIDALPPSKENE